MRQLAPPAFKSHMLIVDNYIKAFYFKWDELAAWCQVRRCMSCSCACMHAGRWVDTDACMEDVAGGGVASL